MLRITAIALLLASLVAGVGCSGGSAPTVNTRAGGSTPPTDPSSPGAVSIYPASETLRIGGQRQFSGWDSTVGQYDVIWSLQEGAAAGTVTADGLYATPSTLGTHDSAIAPNVEAEACVSVNDCVNLRTTGREKARHCLAGESDSRR